jgi:hypothetical protein
MAVSGNGPHYRRGSLCPTLPVRWQTHDRYSRQAPLGSLTRRLCRVFPASTSLTPSELRRRPSMGDGPRLPDGRAFRRYPADRSSPTEQRAPNGCPRARSPHVEFPAAAIWSTPRRVRHHHRGCRPGRWVSRRWLSSAGRGMGRGDSHGLGSVRRAAGEPAADRHLVEVRSSSTSPDRALASTPACRRSRRGNSSGTDSRPRVPSAAGAPNVQLVSTSTGDLEGGPGER